MPAFAAPCPAEQRVDPRQRGDVIILLATVTATLELLGQMTAREPEAEGLIRVVRETWG